MKVLVACEESQEVCKAFRALGHEAYSCDIQEPSGGHPEWHILGDAVDVVNRPIGVITTMDGETHSVRAAATAISMGNSTKVCLPRIGPKTAQRPSPASPKLWRSNGEET